MRWITRTFLALTVTLLAGWVAYDQLRALYVSVTATSANVGQGSAQRGGERRPIVTVATTQVTSITPVTEGFAQAIAPRRAAVATGVDGVVLRSSLEDGATFSAGEILFELSNISVTAALEDASIARARAEAEIAQIARRQAAAEAARARAEDTLAIRLAELARVEDLRGRGGGTAQQRDTAEVAAISARGVLAAEEDALASLAQEARLAELSRREAVLAERVAQDAQTTLTVRAPLDGVYFGQNLVIGGKLSAGTELGAVIDVSEIELELRLSPREVARLTDENGLLALPVALERLGDGRAFTAVLDRITVTEGEAGAAQAVIARVDRDPCQCVLPGDRFAFSIAERRLDNVVLLPATALSGRDELLELGPGDGLIGREVRVLRRIGAMAVIEAPDAPLHYVVTRTPRLGEGLRVDPREAENLNEARRLLPRAVQGG